MSESRFAWIERGGIRESEHDGTIAVVDVSGKLVASFGDVDFVTFARSSAKPIQAIPMVESGAADYFHFTDEEIALCCASHSSEPRHINGVLQILEKIGLDGSHLKCGTHLPLNMGVYDSLLKSGQDLSSVYSNCSGKHSGMLAYAQFLHADVDSYLEPSHPVQQAILKTLSDLSEVPMADITLGTDGCGVPTFALSMRQWAVAFSNFACVRDMPHRIAMTRISRAMRAYPLMVAGDRRFDTELMVATDGGLLVKGGAEGFIAVVAQGAGLAMVFKVRDGNERSIYPVVIKALRDLGVLGNEAYRRLDVWAEPVLRNTRGDRIGRVVADFTLREY